MGSPHLTWVERYQIERCLAEELTVAVIAVRLGRHPSCIYDELKRGRQPDGCGFGIAIIVGFAGDHQDAVVTIAIGKKRREVTQVRIAVIEPVAQGN